MDAKAVEERYGVPPEKYVELKALDGDTSDNLPGVPGVGTKTAAKLVQKYGSAEEAVAHADEQTPKLAKNLAEHGEQVAINKKLSTLQEVPLEGVTLADLKMGGWDMEQVRELFISLEFRTLLERLMADLPEAAEGEGDPFELEVQTFAAPERLKELSTLVADAGGRHDRRHSDRSARSAPVDRVRVGRGRRPRSCRSAPTELSADEVRAGLGGVLEDAAVAKVAHDGRAAILSLDAIGIELGGLRLDTHIGAYLLDPGAPNYALEEIARKYTGRELKAVDGVERDDEATRARSIWRGSRAGEIEAEDASLRALAVAGDRRLASNPSSIVWG